MKVRIILLITAVILIAIVKLGLYYGSMDVEDDSEISILSYREPELVNESGYEIKKYEGIEIKKWLDYNKVLTYKLNDDGSEQIMSSYDLNTKEFTDFRDLNVVILQDVSPTGRYVMFSEGGNNVGKQSWAYLKQNILDLTNGQIIYNFDKKIESNGCEYRYINDDYIFINYFSVWKIINKNGEVKAEGKFDYTDSNDKWCRLLDVREIQCDGENISGQFYYIKEFRGEDNNIGVAVYSTDINTRVEKLIEKCEHSTTAEKSKDFIAIDFFKNNSKAVDKVYLNRTFGINIFNKDGTLVRTYELPLGRNYTNLCLSSDGKRCAFVEMDTGKTSNESLKVLNIDTGEVKEIISVDNIIDKEHENLEIDYSKYHNINHEVRIVNLNNLTWDKTGKNLIFNYVYKSMDDGENHTNSYIVKFDN